jgi:hypothetical protein
VSELLFVCLSAIDSLAQPYVAISSWTVERGNSHDNLPLEPVLPI